MDSHNDLNIQRKKRLLNSKNRAYSATKYAKESLYTRCYKEYHRSHFLSSIEMVAFERDVMLKIIASHFATHTKKNNFSLCK